MRHNIVPSPPLICTAESEAGQAQRCAAPHSVMENYYEALVLCLSISFFMIRYMSITLHFRAKYCIFYLLESCSYLYSHIHMTSLTLPLT